MRHSPPGPSQRTRFPWRALALSSIAFFHLAHHAAAEAKILSAARDFQPVRESPFVNYYTETKSADPAEHGAAIQTPRHQDRPAAAEFIYPGPPGVYDLTLLAVAEEDGESVYRILVDDRDLGTRRNPPQTGKRIVMPHRWRGIALKKDTRLRVVFAGHTNGKIPEGSGTAWSRGRWRALVIETASTHEGAPKSGARQTPAENK